MRNISVVLGMILLANICAGQTSTTTPSLKTISKNSINDNNVKVKLAAESHDHFMLNLTFDNVMDRGADSFYNSSIFNPNLGFYFLYDIPLGNSGMSFAPGAGFTFSKVNLDNSILYQDSMGSTFLPTTKHPMFGTGSKLSYDGSSFYTSWIELPVELRYRSKPINGRSCIKAAIGFRAGLRLGANSKVSYADQTLSRDVTMKTSPYSDLNSFRYGVTFRIGYGALNLFGYYGLNQLIKDSKNYNNLDLRQYSIGISITGM